MARARKKSMIISTATIIALSIGIFSFYGWQVSKYDAYFLARVPSAPAALFSLCLGTDLFCIALYLYHMWELSKPEYPENYDWEFTG